MDSCSFWKLLTQGFLIWEVCVFQLGKASGFLHRDFLIVEASYTGIVFGKSSYKVRFSIWKGFQISYIETVSLWKLLTQGFCNLGSLLVKCVFHFGRASRFLTCQVFNCGRFLHRDF